MGVVMSLPPRHEQEAAFNPRAAAMTHAGMAQQLAAGHADAGVPAVVAELANAVACGLVYVGDQIGRLVDEQQTARAAPAAKGGTDDRASE